MLSWLSRGPSFSWVYNIPRCDLTPVCLSILPLMDIWVIPSRLAFGSKDAVTILV